MVKNVNATKSHYIAKGKSGSASTGKKHKCTHCNKSYANLKSHIKNKHPEEEQVIIE